MAPLATLLAILLFVPTMALVTPAPPREVRVAGNTSDVITVDDGGAVAYHVLRGPQDAVNYTVEVLAGGRVDVYLMPASEYDLYRGGAGGSFLVPYSAQDTLAIHRSIQDPDLGDVYLVVDNRPGPTGADPDGPVTARVSIDEQAPNPSGLALGILAIGGVIGVLGVVPPMARAWWRRRRRSSAMVLPPPPLDYPLPGTQPRRGTPVGPSSGGKMPPKIPPGP